MNVAKITAALALAFSSLLACPLLTAQSPAGVASISIAAQPAIAVQPANSAQLPADAAPIDAVTERNRALRAARSLHICSETMFLTTGTLDRALMRQRDWDRLGLNIVNNPSHADLELQVNRVVFTHVHTYILTDKASGIVLASGKVTAFDGVIASGPMAEQIVKILSAARLQPGPASSHSGL
jgi:hypothetical protein